MNSHPLSKKLPKRISLFQKKTLDILLFISRKSASYGLSGPDVTTGLLR